MSLVRALYGQNQKSGGIFSEHTSCQFLCFHCPSLQVEYALPKPENFEKSLPYRETRAKMAI